MDNVESPVALYRGVGRLMRLLQVSWEYVNPPDFVAGTTFCGWLKQV